MSGKCQMADGLEMTMGIFFRSRQSKAIDPESMLWLEKFAHTVLTKANPSSYLAAEKLMTKSLQSKNKDLSGGLPPDPYDIGVYKDAVLRGGKVQ